jgi:hypothetical protein
VHDTPVIVATNHESRGVGLDDVLGGLARVAHKVDVPVTVGALLCVEEAQSVANFVHKDGGRTVANGGVNGDGGSVGGDHAHARGAA